MRKMGMIIDPRELDFDELISYRDMEPSALPLKDWQSTFASGKSSLKKAKASYEKYQKKYDKKYLEYGYDINASEVDKYVKRISEILDKEIVSQATSSRWKKSFGDRLRKVFKLPNTTWRVNKHPLDQGAVKGLSTLVRRMKNFGGAKFAMDSDEMLLLARAAGMPENMSEDYKQQKELSLQQLGVYKVGMEHLHEDLQRIGVATAAREAMDHKRVTEEHAAKKKAAVEKKRRAAEKRRQAKAEKAIQVASKKLAKRPRGRSQSPVGSAKRSRSTDPPKAKGSKRRSASRDRGEKPKKGRGGTTPADIVRERHRGRTTGKDPGAQRGGQQRGKPSAARLRTKSPPRRGKPSVASGASPYVSVEKDSDL